MNDFIHNEFQQLGTDYNSIEEVAFYDERMRKFRNIESENNEIINLAELNSESEVLEIGSGTGAFSRQAAKIAKQVTAIDISPIMLEYAAKKSFEENLMNIGFKVDGFLSFNYPGNFYNAVVSSLALHHLSDVWKSVALEKIYKSLKPNGIFILVDVVFDWRNEKFTDYFKRLLESAPGSRSNFSLHIADELSTLGWIMRGLLEHAGFTIEFEHCRQDFLCIYKCRKSMA